MKNIDIVYSKNNISYTHKQMPPPKIVFHLHEGYELYLLISGDVNYFIEKKIYALKQWDLMLINNHEIHKPSFLTNKIYERITLEFNPNVLKSFNSPIFDLCNCFTSRINGEQNRLPLNKKQLDTVLEVFQKMEAISVNPVDGSEILMRCYLVELIVFINRMFLKTTIKEDMPSINNKLSSILEYIDDNLDGDLSLETLGKEFYINKYYLCKLFKQNTSSSIHNYIIYKRLSKARRLLSEGLNVTETCIKSGFIDYSNFLKTFKRTVGVSPGKYKSWGLKD